MEGLIFDVKRFAVHDGDGIRTTVFFKGCPLRCLWCHNPEGLESGTQLALFTHRCTGCGACASVCPAEAHALEDNRHTFLRERCLHCGACVRVCAGGALTAYGKRVTPKSLLPQLTADREFYEVSGGGVTLSGGECLLQPEFCQALLKALKAEGIHTAVDTCGFVSRDALERVMPDTDIFLYDMKAYDEDVHIRCTGCSNRQILENLIYLDEAGCPLEIRIPFVPQYNDDQIEKIAAFLQTRKHIRKVRVLPYHNYAGSKYLALGKPNTLPDRLPLPQELENAAATLRSFGLPVVQP